MTIFRISYKDPETGEAKEVDHNFTATRDGTTAKEWAEDYAYAVADKGWFTIEELK